MVKFGTLSKTAVLARETLTGMAIAACLAHLDRSGQLASTPVHALLPKTGMDLLVSHAMAAELGIQASTAVLVPQVRIGMG